MPIFKILNTITKTAFNTTRIATKTASREIAKNKKGVIADWKYNQLDNTPFLFGSETLKPYVRNVIKIKDEEKALQIVNYLKRHKAYEVESYQILLKMLKKSFKTIDITDLF